jgi:hypothetical protein
VAEHNRQKWSDVVPIPELVAPVWKRQKGETSAQYSRFAKYRDYPREERTLARLSRELHRDAKTIGMAAKRWRWAERVDLWDAHLEEIAVRAQEKAVAEMNERHADLALQGLRKIM